MTEVLFLRGFPLERMTIPRQQSFNKDSVRPKASAIPAGTVPQEQSTARKDTGQKASMVPTGTVLFGRHSTVPWEQFNPRKARDQRQAQFHGNWPLQEANGLKAKQVLSERARP